MKDFVDVFNALERMNIIGPGNYGKLKQMLCDIDLHKLVHDIEIAEKAQGCSEFNVNVLHGRGSRSSGSLSDTGLGSLDAAGIQSAVFAEDQDDAISWNEMSLTKRRRKQYARGRGLVVIITNFTEGRQGSHFDEVALKETFENLNYKVLKPSRNLDEEAFLKHLDFIPEKIRRDSEEEGVEYCSLFICISSHGRKEAVMTNDKQLIEFNTIINKFNGENLRRMAGKPKVFLFQCCRGTEHGRGVDVSDATPEEAAAVPVVDHGDPQISIRTIPANADMLVAYATSVGTRAYRNEDQGTWFLHHLCEVIKRDYRRDHLLDILTSVNGLIAERTHSDSNAYKQMSEQVSTLTKDFYL
ncbi:caspase-3-like [Ptychodera flava]|uniref:caspase-3-like n=1 Tax=Ptychodera flava TaxID=63121 RepID=UPI00396A2D39